MRDNENINNLSFILPNKYLNNVNTTIADGEMAIFIHLHYYDTVEEYFKYIVRIPKNIPIYITVSDKETKEKIEWCIQHNNLTNCTIIPKENRGRDISALLVACRHIILKYEYICFVHDKKEKTDKKKKAVKYWVNTLWENTIGTTEYIFNIKELFSLTPQIGVLVPPNPISDSICVGLTNEWGKNFELTKDLVKELNVQIEPDAKKSPITLGTMFWCRTKALYKLFHKEWKYEDFQEEPLPNDGTLSHAIERVFAYVAQDAGYSTGVVMTSTYAEQQVSYHNFILTEAFDKLNQYMGIASIHDLLKFEHRKENLEKFFNKYPCVYIYGAGIKGDKVYTHLKAIERFPKGFIVSNGNRMEKKYKDLPVYEISEMELTKECGIIVAVGDKYKDEIMEELSKIGFANILLIDTE